MRFYELNNDELNIVIFVALLAIWYLIGKILFRKEVDPITSTFAGCLIFSALLIIGYVLYAISKFIFILIN